MKDAEAVKRYRDRKLFRLKARFDADDVDWITTESGSHIPIKDGVAIGGPLKGQKFLRATTEKPDGTKKRTSTRRRRRTASTRKTAGKTTSKTGTNRSKPTAKTEKPTTPKLTATHQKFKDRLKDYQAKAEQAVKDAKKYDEEAFDLGVTISEFKRYDRYTDAKKSVFTLADYRDRLEKEIATQEGDLKDLRKLKKKLENPPKKGQRGWEDYYFLLRRYEISSKSIAGKKEAVEERIRRESQKMKENKLGLEIWDDFEKTGKLARRDEVLAEFESKKRIATEKAEKARSDEQKYKQARKDLIGKTLKTWDDCKDSEDIQNRLLNSGMFKTPETTKDPLFGMYDIQDTNSLTNLSRCDFQSLKSVVKHFDAFFERYPKLKGAFYPPDAYKPETDPEFIKERDKAFACTSMGTGKVHLNTAFLEDPEKFAESEKKMKQKNHRAVYGYQAVVFHEYGHSLDGLLTKALRKSEEIKDYQMFSDRVMEKCLEKFKMNELELHKSLCNYGIGDRSEFLAEAFAEYTCSEKPRKIAQYVGKLVEDEMRKQGYL